MKMIFTQALTRPNALWHTLMRNFKIDPVPLHQSKSFCNVVSFFHFKSVILLWTLVIQSVLSQKKKEPPHLFYVDHCFGTAGLLTQLPLATNIAKKRKSTGSSDSKSWTFPTHHHHPARDCFDCSITCKSTFLAYSFSQLPISCSDGVEIVAGTAS